MPPPVMLESHLRKYKALIIPPHSACLISNTKLPALVFHMTCVSLTLMCIVSGWCLLYILLTHTDALTWTIVGGYVRRIMCCWSEEMYSSVIMEMDRHEREQTKRVSWKMINAIKAAFRDVSFSQPTYN